MKVFLAGMESSDSFRMAYKLKPKNILMTHMYLRKMSLTKVEEMLKKAKEAGMSIIVDSGAFTFLIKYAILRKDISIEELKKNHRIEALEEGNEDKDTRLYTDVDYAQEMFDKEFNGYINKWLEYCEVYYKYADMIAEVDLDTLLGMEKMWELRKRYQKFHDKICYTPHLGMRKPNKAETPEERMELQKLFDLNPVYMGIGNIDYRAVQAFFVDNQRILTEKKIKVHGWAQTSAERMKNIPFYSVDSSTWLDGAKFGICFEFQDGWSRLKTHDSSASKKLRSQWKHEAEAAGIDYELFDSENNDALNEWNMLQWIKFADYWGKDLLKAYWLSDEEKEAEVDKRREDSGINSLIVRETVNTSVALDERNKLTRICNSCNISDKCTRYQPGATCVFNFTGLTAEISGKDALKQLLDIQMGRVSQAVLIERVQGANLDINVTKEIQTTANLAKTIAGLENDKSSNGSDTIKIEATGKGAGVLSKLFGSAPEKEEKKEEVVYEVVQ